MTQRRFPKAGKVADQRKAATLQLYGLMQQQRERAGEHDRMGPDGEDLDPAVGAGTFALTGHTGIRAEDPFEVLEEVGAREQGHEEEAGEDDPNDEK